LPSSLVESIDRLCRMMHPKLKVQAQKEAQKREPKRSVVEESSRFRGLAIPDKPVDDSAAEDNIVQDTLALLESLEPTTKKEKPSRKRSRSPDDRDRDPRRRKERYRSRSRSNERRRPRQRSRSLSNDRQQNGRSRRGRRNSRDFDYDDRA